MRHCNAGVATARAFADSDPMTPILPAAMLRMLAAAAAASPDAEICGLLLGAGEEVTDAPAVRNIAGDPAAAFELDPAALFAALRAERAGGPALLGHYHSHPSGAPIPSPCDATAASADGRLWLILGSHGGSLWRAVAGGAHFSRFDPAPWRLATAQGLQDMPHIFSY